MKKRILSGIQPSGMLHLGNYFGAVHQWISLQDKYDAIFCIVDQHAITVSQDPKELHTNTLELAKLYIALGIDPNKAPIFIQSHVTEHTQLAWILMTITKFTELERMTQFKDKASKHKKNINAGLFTYPVLMAADILLYDADIVPVGIDQKQHVELTRDIAKRFNHQFGDTFVIPEVKLQKVGAKIYGLDDASKKMSKSEGDNNYIALMDDPKVIEKKIKRAVTDSGSEVEYDLEKKPAVSNLLSIYSLATNTSIPEIEKMYAGKGYGDFKADLAEKLIEFLSPIQEKVKAMSDDEVQDILSQGAKIARERASQTLQRVYEKVGFVLPK